MDSDRPIQIVMGLLSESTLEELRSAGHVAQAILDANQIRYRSSGLNLMMSCPTPEHEDRNPSAHLDVNSGLWHCFGCGAGGDVLRLVEVVEGVGFRDAAERVAAAAGVTIETVESSSGFAPAHAPVLAQVASRWHEALQTNTDAQRYLADRGVTFDDAVAFRLGWCPTDLGWTESLDTNVLVELGLLRVGFDQTLVSPMADRVTFPWIDNADRTRGFGARWWRTPSPPNNSGKYVNSSTSASFNKSRLLYGTHRAHRAIRQTGRVVIVEGYFDVISAHRAGVTETVASGGVAVTAQHVDWLSRFADRAVLCGDGDTSGRLVARKAVENLTWQPLTPYVMDSPEGSDPDDWATADPEGFRAAVDSPVSAVDMTLTEAAEQDLDDPATLAKVTARVRDVIDRCVTPLARPRTHARAAETLRVPPDAFTAPRTPEPARQAVVASQDGSEVDALEMQVVKAMHRHPDLTCHWVDADWVTDPNIATVFGLVWEQADPARIVTQLDDTTAGWFRALINDPAPMSPEGAVKAVVLWLIRITRTVNTPDIVRARHRALKGDHEAVEILFQCRENLTIL